MLIHTSLLLFILSMFPIQQTQALSCAQTFPLVGIVHDVTEHDTYTEFTLKQFYTFDTSDWSTSGSISIDLYENIVSRYVSNNFHLSEQLAQEHSLEKSGKITIPVVAFKQVDITPGDILIKGPPFHVCSYRFTGIFNDDGSLRKAIISDDYQDYSYQGSTLEVEAGRELDCNGSACTMEVNYVLDGEPFTLSPGQLHTPASGNISSVHLLESSDLKKRSDHTTVFDWGFSTYATYIIDFSYASTHSPQESSPTQNMNVFQRIWLWLKSLFG